MSDTSTYSTVGDGENVKKDEGFVVGMDLVALGRWMQVEDASENGEHAWAVDQNGEGHDITLGDVDHFYD